jgi:hypothetical protein
MIGVRIQNSGWTPKESLPVEAKQLSGVFSFAALSLAPTNSLVIFYRDAQKVFFPFFPIVSPPLANFPLESILNPDPANHLWVASRLRKCLMGIESYGWMGYIFSHIL